MGSTTHTSGSFNKVIYCLLFKYEASSPMNFLTLRNPNNLLQINSSLFLSAILTKSSSEVLVEISFDLRLLK